MALPSELRGRIEEAMRFSRNASHPGDIELHESRATSILVDFVADDMTHANLQQAQRMARAIRDGRWKGKLG